MHLTTFLSATVLLAGASAQSSQSLTKLLANNDLLSGLATLLGQYPSIANSLAAMKNVTILAPDNKAIQAAQSSGMFSTKEAAVQAVLSYHVLPGMIPSSTFTSTPIFAPTTLNDTTYTNVTGGQVIEAYLPQQIVTIKSGLKSFSTVVSADHKYDGGIVHIIDRILVIPPPISTVAELANLTALAGALGATNLLDTVETTPDITVFAPSNAAFQDIGSVAGDLGMIDLTNLLEYHVIKGTVAYSTTLTSGSITTLSGDDVKITVEDGAVFVNGARVINSDILVANGVVHVLDSVLNPNNTAAPSNPTATTVVDAWPAASSAPLPDAITSGITEPSSTLAALVETEVQVVSGYSKTSAAAATGGGKKGGKGGKGGSGGAASSSSSGIAAMPTGAVGAAALFGGAALMANW